MASMNLIPLCEPYVCAILLCATLPMKAAELPAPTLGATGLIWSGAATTTFSVNPLEDMGTVIMGQVMPNDADPMQKVETLVYQALVDTPQP